MHEEIKHRLGITVLANCLSCSCLGDEGEWGSPCLICEKNYRMGYLKSFPFKKEMKCCEPDFWVTKFADMITGDGDNDDKVAAAFRKALDG